ncbi:MAG: hypothetical protein ABR549_17390 [Mycobacteriales bacterium]
MSLTSDAAAAVVRLASRVRGERVIHAKGRAFEGELRIDSADLGVPLFDEPGEHRVLIRLSRGVGLPDLLPDALGLAIRVLDAHGPGRHQDLTLTTGARAPVLRHALLARRDVLGSTYTSILPYDLGGRAWVLGALPATERTVTSLSGLRPEDVRFRLAVAHTRGPWRELGEMRATRVLPNGRRVRFSPFTTGGGIRPAGRLQELRKKAYDASHVGRDA